MEANHKKILKAISLELRHLLEGCYDSNGKWQPGDLEQRLAAIGVRRDRAPVPVDELAHLSDDDKHARTVVDAYLQLRDEADASRENAVAEFVRETAYTWANRLLCLRCMEARELIDEVILEKEAYGGRSLEHHRLAQRDPEVCSGEDDGLFAVLEKVCTDQTKHLPLLFDPQSPGVALNPSPAVLKRCLALLSGTEAVRSQEPATAEVFQAPDALGWAYQYWNTEEKDRVFEMVRTKKGAKISGADIIPATQLYTEPYMVKFLVQNSLGATWMGMHSDSKLYEKWEYYVRDADRAPVERKPVAEITFLDPACGSGHFLNEAFDLYYDMYVEEGDLTEPEDICRSILEKNVFGIDIDARAVQIAEAALWMKAAERAFDFEGSATNLVAAVASHLKGDSWEEFLGGFEREPSVARVLRKFGQAMEHIDELGSLSRPEEELRSIIHAEHATWERQVREQEEANFLFPEMVEDALSGHLPFQEISDEEFGDRLLYRTRAAINAFAGDAREQGVFQDQFLGHETSEGFKLLDMLAGRYDVVAANPPYMGTRKMGAVVKSYISKHYADGKRDLFGAFIVRNLQLTNPGGRLGMITLHTWMFLTSFSSLRSTVVRQHSLESIAHLGRHAFSEADPPGNAAMFVVESKPACDSHSITSFRMTSPRLAHEQAVLLKKGIHGHEDSIVSSTLQSNLLQVPNSPLVYWIHEDIFRLLGSENHVEELGGVKQGLATGDNTRHLRFHWETSDSNPNWVRYAKGGGYCKWCGLLNYVVDWRAAGAMYSHSPRAAVRNPSTYFKSGLTYTLMARGALGVRVIENSVYDVASMSLFPPPEVKSWLMGVLNCRVASYLARVISQDIKFNTGYVSALPVPSLPETQSVQQTVDYCVALKSYLISKELTEETCSPIACTMATTLGDCCKLEWQKESVVASLLHCAEAYCEDAVISDYGIAKAALRDVLDETGTPAGWFPLVSEHNALPESPDDLPTLPDDVAQFLNRLDYREISESEKTEMLSRLRSLYESGPGADDEDAGTPDDGTDAKEDATIGTHIPIRAETFLEELAQQLQLHPIAVLRLLEYGVQHEGWRSLPLEQRIVIRLLVVFILRLLGHRWPKQIETCEPVQEWADPDGIIPFADGTDESTLLERVRERISADFKDGDVASIEREFAEIMGKPLEEWLSMEFFKHHTKQFKKRPIAWQIQSGKFTTRKKPAFACLVYYHRLDGDLLPKIRNQYVGPLRSRLETELRSIESVSSDARSDRQESRRGELQAQIDELRDFDSALQKVITEGFASKELTKIVEDEPLDKWCSLDGTRPVPESQEALLQQESRYFPDINDGVRVNIAPLQKAGLLAADVLAKKDLDKAIADRARWRADERRWCRENKLPQPGWWLEDREDNK